MTPHDTCYKLLFSHPRMIHDLVTGFIDEDWVASLDLASREKVNGSYVTGSARERFSDMVWRVRWGDSWVYVYLLLEFQSSVDRVMAVRVMTYLGLLYQDLQRQTPGAPLPPVVPIVLYNGDGRWTAPVDIAALLGRVPGGPDRYCPALRYLLIDEGRIVDDPAWTLRSRNVVYALFRLEHNRDEEDVLAVLQRLSEWLRVDEQSSLQDAFVVWIRQVLLPRHAPDVTDDELEQLRSQPMGREGVCMMLAEKRKLWSDRWVQKGLEQGLEQGLEKGLEQGRQEGGVKVARQMLERQIVRKYGIVPDWAQARIDQAGIEQLEAWVDAIFDAETVESLLSAAPGR